MTFGREPTPVSAEAARDRILHLTDDGQVRAVVTRTIGTVNLRESPGASVWLDRGTEGWSMTVLGFGWGVQPTIAVLGDGISVTLRDDEERVVEPQDETDTLDLAALGVFSLLDPRTVVSRAISTEPSGTFEEGRLDCVVDLRTLELPPGYLRFLGRPATFHPVRLLFRGGTLVEMRQRDLPPAVDSEIIESF